MLRCCRPTLRRPRPSSRSSPIWSRRGGAHLSLRRRPAAPSRPGSPPSSSAAGRPAARSAPAPTAPVADHRAALVAALFAGLTLTVVALSVPTRRPGEYYFLLGCAMTGGVVLGYAGDLITLIVALETLTLPLYALIALRTTGID